MPQPMNLLSLLMATRNSGFLPPQMPELRVPIAGRYPAPDPGPMRRPAPPLYPTGAPSRPATGGQMNLQPAAMPNMRGPLPAHQQAQAPGFMGAPTMRGFDQGEGSFGGVFGRMFAGADDPNLTISQNDAIRKQALIDAGLGLLVGSSSPVGKPGLMQALGTAAMMSNQMAEGRRGQASEKNTETAAAKADAAARSALAGVLGGDITHESLDKASQAAIRLGFDDLVPEFTKMKGEIPKAGESLKTFTRPDGTQVSVFVGKDGNVRVPEVHGDTPPPKVPAEWRDIEINGVTYFWDENNQLRDPYTHSVVTTAPILTGGGPHFDLNDADKIGDNFRQDTRDIIQALSNSDSAALAPDNSAGDVQLMFAWAKLMDPGGRVTDSDIKLGQDLGGLEAGILGWKDRLQSNRFAARQELVTAIAALQQQKRRELAEWRAHYERQVRRLKMDPSDVIPNITTGSVDVGGAGDISQEGSEIDTAFASEFENAGLFPGTVP